MRSMTGFGQSSHENGRLRASVTARSVNHRYLDLSVSLRTDDPEMERRVESLLEERLERGRVDLRVEIEAKEAVPARVEVDEGLLRALQELVSDLGGRGLVSREVVLGDLLRIPDLLRFEQESPIDGAEDDEDAAADREADFEVVLEAVGHAVGALVAMREEEGTKLRRMLEERVDGLEELRREMLDLAADLPAQRAESLRRRLAEMVGQGEMDESRLAQEAAILADRSDVAEELDRLGAHLEQFREVCDADGSLGKRLDFLAQEILRELNTVGSKCRESEITRRVVDAKVLCEQIREQVQNVE